MRYPSQSAIIAIIGFILLFTLPFSALAQSSAAEENIKKISAYNAALRKNLDKEVAEERAFFDAAWKSKDCHRIKAALERLDTYLELLDGMIWDLYKNKNIGPFHPTKGKEYAHAYNKVASLKYYQSWAKSVSKDLIKNCPPKQPKQAFLITPGAKLHVRKGTEKINTAGYRIGGNDRLNYFPFNAVDAILMPQLVMSYYMPLNNAEYAQKIFNTYVNLLLVTQITMTYLTHDIVNNHGDVAGNGNNALIPGVNSAGASLNGSLADTSISDAATASNIDQFEIETKTGIQIETRDGTAVTLSTGLTHINGKQKQSFTGKYASYGFGADFGVDYKSSFDYMATGPNFGISAKIPSAYENLYFNFGAYLSFLHQSVDAQDSVRLGTDASPSFAEARADKDKEWVTNFGFEAAATLLIPETNSQLKFYTAYERREDEFYYERDGFGASTLKRDHSDNYEFGLDMIITY